VQDFELHAWHFILCLRCKIRLIVFRIKMTKKKFVSLFKETVSDA